jgi:threonine synthase
MKRIFVNFLPYTGMITTTKARGRRDFAVRCAVCARLTEPLAYRCATCEGPLVLDLVELAERPAPIPDAVGVWRYGTVLPRTRHAVTLGEGATPVLPLVSPATKMDLRVVGKLESLNPTLSFKDRAMALAASFALDLGVDGLVLASSGNAAVSAAAYATTAGLRCRVFCGNGSRAGLKLAIAASYGAEVVVVDGDYSAAYAAAVDAEGDRWLNVSTTYRNPLLAEAYRTIPLELVEQLGDMPDAVVVPVGAGPLLRGVYQGFGDLVSAGVAEHVPRLIAVQAAACAPLARAWASDDWLVSLREPIEVGATSAAAIADALRGYEREGLLTLEAARSSDGLVVAVSERSIEQSLRSLLAQGVLVEPAAATPLAALADPSVAKILSDSATVVLILTGHGAKEHGLIRPHSWGRVSAPVEK